MPLSKRLESLRIYETDLKLVRWGKPNDGGYIVAADVPVDLILSGGIAGENSFETHALDMCRHALCLAHDPTGSPGDTSNMRYTFHEVPLGYSGLYVKRNVLVKMDIEGGEWEWLRGLTDSQLSHVSMLVCELHDMGNRTDADWDQLTRIAKTHTCIWAHANTGWDWLVDVDGVQIPKTLECTWVRTDLISKKRPSRRPVPGELDMPNVPGRPDADLSWEPFVHD